MEMIDIALFGASCFCAFVGQVVGCCFFLTAVSSTDVLHVASFSLIVTNLSIHHYLDKLKEQISLINEANRDVAHNVFSNVLPVMIYMKSLSNQIMFW